VSYVPPADVENRRVEEKSMGSQVFGFDMVICDKHVAPFALFYYVVWNGLLDFSEANFLCSELVRGRHLDRDDKACSYSKMMALTLVPVNVRDVGNKHHGSYRQ
jgi:hypothetical protein